MKLKKTLLHTAVALGLAGSAMTAQAGAFAISYVDVSNLKFNIGGVQATTTELQHLTYTSDAQSSVDLNGFAGSDSDASGSADPVPHDVDTFKILGTSNPAYVDNAFIGAIPASPLSVSIPAPNADYAIGDTLDNGSPINGSSARLRNLSVASIDFTGSAQSQTNNTLTASWQFIAGANGILSFDYNLKYYLEAFLDPNMDTGSYAIDNLAITWKVDQIGDSSGLFTNPLDIVNLMDDTFSKQTSRTAPNYPLFADIKSQTGANLSNSTSSALVSGNIYQLSASVQTLAKVKATFVPAPGVLALMGIGLIGMAGTRRNRVK